MTPLHALLLGLVQGLTEFLPVSSSGHLVLAARWLGMPTGGLTVEVWLHGATLLAVVIALRSELWSILRGLGADGGERAVAWRYVLALAVGTLPAVVVGLTARDAVESAFTSLRWVGADLIVTALVLMASRWCPGGRAPLTPWRALLIGVAQAAAILPGISRSGSTLVAGLALGLAPADAARFSFLLSIPVILGAVVLQLGALWELGSQAPMALSVGFLAAAASGYVAIRIVWGAVERGRLWVFAPYCFVVGIIALLVGGRVVG